MKASLFSTVALFVSMLSGLNASSGSKGPNTIFFTENKGQVCDQNFSPRPDVLFNGCMNDVNYYLTSSGVSYQLSKTTDWKFVRDEKSLKDIKIPASTSIYRIDVNWLGANPNAVVKGMEALEGCENYYLSHCSNGALNVKSYRSIMYTDVYSNIDMKWYQKNNELEYDFIVKPNADPNQIKIEIKGAKKLMINEKGELEIVTPYGVIIEKKPIAYQNEKIIKANWSLNNNIVTFVIGPYDKSKVLVIDPALRRWGTYYGGSLDDYGRACKADASGNVFFTGYTANATTTLIATVGSHQSTFGGGSLDAFLAKFNAAGVRQWATYYGDAGNDVSYCVEVDGTNEYIGGYTTSTTTAISTVGSHQTVQSGGNDGFMVKFDQNGVRVWGTFYGGTGSDVVNGCSKDASGNIYFSGNSSSNGSISSGGHQNAYAGGIDAFLVKFSPAGVRLWATYYGGTSTENGTGCSTDATGAIYMVGKTQSSTGSAVASGGHQTTFGGGGEDAFLVKFNSAGVRQWGTYYGGNGVDNGFGCATDAANNVYMVGLTGSATSTLIATVGSYQTTYGGSGDAFFAKFNSAGVRQWGTYYGAVGADDGLGCTVNSSGDLLVVGSTNSPSGISTPGAHQVTLAGGYDGYLSCIDNTNGQLKWGTYYGGGTGSDYSTGICTNTSGFMFMSGYTTSPLGNTIATPNGHQTTHNGLNDGFLVKFADCQPLSLTITPSSTAICSGQSATLTATGSGFTSYAWSTSQNTSSISVSPTTTTNYSVTANTATANCILDAYFTLSVTPMPTVVVTPASTVVCSGNSATLTASGASTYSWSTGPITNSIVITPTALTQPIVTGYNGICTHSIMVNVGVSPTPTINITGAPNATYCSGGALTMTASGAITYTWTSGPTSSVNVVSPTVATVYTVTGTIGQCSSTKTISVSMIQTPTVSVNAPAYTICPGATITIAASGASTYSWNTSTTTSSVSVSPTVNTTYTVTGYNGACSDSKSSVVTITNNISISAVSSPTQLCVGQQATLSANGAISYTWSTNANSNTIVVTPTASTTFTVFGVSGSCTGTTQINLGVDPTPTVSASASSSLICVNNTVALTATGANSYTWMPGNLSGTSITDMPSGTTVYTVTGENAFNCKNSETVQVTVDPCTGINEVSSSYSAIRISPNPNNGSFKLQVTELGTYSIFSSIGQLIQSIDLKEKEQAISLVGFSSGVYYLVGSTVKAKFIVNN